MLKEMCFSSYFNNKWPHIGPSIASLHPPFASSPRSAATSSAATHPSISTAHSPTTEYAANWTRMTAPSSYPDASLCAATSQLFSSRTLISVPSPPSPAN